MANKKNGGVIPAISDERTRYVPVGCGKCMECRKKKGREWQVRLLEDIKHEKNGIFVTLTFSNESIAQLSTGLHKLEGYERDNAIAKKAVRRFCERWRKKYKKSIRHWLVTELGHKGTENIHLHGILWTNNRKDIHDIWGYGYTWIMDEKKGWVNEQTVNYITKYLSKQDQQHTEYKPITLTSAGIGKGYLTTANARKNKYKTETDETYRNRQGYKLALPIYYRNHIYTENEKEKLWLEKLDKNERYINGRKIAADDEKTYYEILKTAREQNKRLGYGDDQINWDKRLYENERRNIQYLTRIKEVKNKSNGR